MKRNATCVLLIMSLSMGISNLLYAQTCDGFKTFTQGGWGADCHGNNPGCYLATHFAAAFPSGLTIGCTNKLVLMSSADVNKFLPSGSKASVLPAGTLVNPGSSYRNVLAGQLVALTLNVVFDRYDPDFATSSTSTGSLIISSGTYAGWTVDAFLSHANQVIGGCNVSPSALADINSTADQINNNYDNGTSDNGFLNCGGSPPPQLSLNIISSIDCNGNSSGQISSQIIDGTAPFSYAWSNGATTQDLNNVPAGNYSLTITDAEGRTAQASVLLSEPEAITISVSSADVTCFGMNNGSAYLIVSGGTAPYSILWSTGGITYIEDDLTAGEYSVSITDGNGCTASSSVIIHEPSAISVVSTQSNITCGGAHDGSASVSVSGGTIPYTYLWSNGAQSASVDQLHPGNYSVMIQDGIGCGISVGFTITEPEPIVVSISTEDVTCYNGKGNATVEILSGGVEPYTFSWTGFPDESDAFLELPAGQWTVTVTDSTGCSSVNEFTIHTLSCEGLITLTADDWSQDCSSSSFGCYRDDNFGFIFPTGVTIGSCDRYITFTSSSSVASFLPNDGTISELEEGVLIDPVSYQNSLATEVLALTLNVSFDVNDDDFAPSSKPLRDMIIASGIFEGWSVLEVLDEANYALGGCSTFSLNDIYDIVSSINLNYQNGTVNNGLLICPCDDVIGGRQGFISGGLKDIGTLSISPNPASEHAMISFKVETSSQVRVQVYEVATGYLISNVFDAYANAGQLYSIDLPTHTMKSGVYAVKLYTTAGVQTSQVVIVK